jgi:ribosome maturation factor RimP
VSSPGLERPLRRPDHWQKVRGDVVVVKTRVDGASERLRGVLTDVDDDGVELDVDGTSRRVAFTDVTQARTVFEWGPAEKVTR